MTDELMALLAKATADDATLGDCSRAADACIDFCRTELPALIAERDALRRIVELADVIVAGVNEVKADRYPPLFAAMRAYPVARAALGASHDAK